MSEEIVGRNPRILIVDDNRAIHEDFRRILASTDRGDDAVAAMAAEIFGTASPAQTLGFPALKFEVDSAFQGEEGLVAVVRAQAGGRPYAMAFVDMRMPPGWDGLETVARLWGVQPDLQVVICTAFSDYSWHEILRKLAYLDRLLILRKPFANEEVQQMAAALTEKWRLTQQSRLTIVDLETEVRVRTTQLQATLEQLAEAKKMEGIGQLAGGIAHDFNNLLTVIQGHCELLLLNASATDTALTGSATEIQTAANRAAHLTRQLLAFSRRQPMHLQRLDLNEVVLDMVGTVGRLLGGDIVLHTGLLAGGAWVEGDSGMINQVVLNLAANAREAMSKGGELWLNIEAVMLDETTARQHPAGRPGSFVCLSLRDTGRGIPAADLPHIFEPFFTTKEVGKGPGLGLATVHGIIEQHHGWIEVESLPGQGTTFRIHLAFLPQSTAFATGPRDASPIRGGNESILVVEDEPAVLALAVKILGASGYRVQAAHNGVAALESWRQQAGAFDLLLTDMIMPDGISGAQLAGQLKAEQPRLRVVYMSGYPDENVNRGLTLREDVNFLPKPFVPARLAKIVRSCLDAE
jgi:signal transduction histidine kinase